MLGFFIFVVIGSGKSRIYSLSQHFDGAFVYTEIRTIYPIGLCVGLQSLYLVWKSAD